MEKFLESDWLKAKGGTTAKKDNKIQISQRIEQCDWLINNRNIIGPIKCCNLLAGAPTSGSK